MTAQQTPQMRAHNSAIDLLCANLLAGKPSLEGVADEYANTLAVEQQLQPSDYRSIR